MAPSKLLDKRWKQREKEIHRKKLRSVQSGIRKVMESGYNSAKAFQGQGLRNGKKEALAERKLILMIIDLIMEVRNNILNSYLLFL